MGLIPAPSSQYSVSVGSLSTQVCFVRPLSKCSVGTKTQEQNKMFILGMGYVGLALGRHLQSLGWNVSGTCTTEERRQTLQSHSFPAFIFDSENVEYDQGLSEEGIHAMSNATHLVTTIPPAADSGKDPVLLIFEERLHDIAKNMNLKWIGYLSSTGVYGDFHGEWVDENTEPRPVEKRAVERLRSENAWLHFGSACDVSVQVFRLGGIYGPGRSAINTLLSSGKLSHKQQNRERRKYTSRIHVKDICQVLTASIRSPYPGRIYNVVDDEPASRTEVFLHAQDLICEKWPSLKSSLLNMDDLRTSSEKELPNLHSCAEKRVMNKRIKEELQVQLLYPSYKHGLKAIIEELDIQT